MIRSSASLPPHFRAQTFNGAVWHSPCRTRPHMRSRARAGLVVVCLHLAAMSSTAHAESALKLPSEADYHKAQALANKARGAFDGKRYGKAIQLWERAYALDSDPTYRYAISIAYMNWPGKCSQAVQAHRDYLELCRGCADKEALAEDRLYRLLADCGDAPKTRAPKQPSRTVEAVGLADLREGATSQVRDEAITNGLKNAMMQAQGAYIETMMQDASEVVSEGDRQRLEGVLRDSLRVASSGFVRSYRVLSESKREGGYQVRLEVTVDDAGIQAELDQVRRQVVERWHPRVVLVTDETFVPLSGPARQDDRQVFRGLVEAAFRARGFEVMNTGAKLSARAEVPPWRDPGLLRESTRLGADYLVTARTKVVATEKGRLATQDLTGTAEIELRAVSLPAEAEVSEASSDGYGPTGSLTEAELVRRSVKHVGRKVTDKVVDEVLASWNEEARSGVRCGVRLIGPGANEAATEFLQVLLKIPGIRNTRTVHAGPGLVSVALVFPPQVDLARLRQDILRFARATPSLASTRPGEVLGRLLTFELGSKGGSGR